MYCQQCGCQYRPGTQVCLNCGTELIESAEKFSAEKASRGLLMAGWIFSILGGLIGLIISSYIAYARVKTGEGALTYKYDDESRQKGRTMLMVCIIIMTLGLILQLAAGL